MTLVCLSPVSSESDASLTEAGCILALISTERHFGGAERSLFELAKSLHHGQGARCHLIVPAQGEWGEQLTSAGIPHTELDFSVPVSGRRVSECLRALTGLVWDALRLLPVVRRLRPAVLHANGVKALLPALVSGFLLRVPCVWHVRDYPRRPRIEKMLCACSTALICPSRFMKDAIGGVSNSATGKVFVVPNPVSPVYSQGITLEGPGDQAVDATFLMAAQLVPWKRLDLYVEAAAQVSAALPGCRFLHAGKRMLTSET